MSDGVESLEPGVFRPRPIPSTTDYTITDDDDDFTGPSWGLIVPIIMICVFLVSVGLCLWWNKWRDKRVLHVNRDNLSFQRSYRGSRSARNNLDTIRDSTRSTVPLRNSLNEKHNKKAHGNLGNVSKVSKINVIPVSRQGKYAFHWDVDHWRGYPPPRTPMVRSGTKPLSPIDEIDSPASVKLSELSRNYDVSNQASFSPYHLAWVTSSNVPSSLGDSGHTGYNEVRNRPPSQFRRSGDGHPQTKPIGWDENQNSPFYPNNNTPTTECETESETSRTWENDYGTVRTGSQFTSYPSSINSQTLHSTVSNSADGRKVTSYGTSLPESSYNMSSRPSGENSSSYFQSGQTSVTDPPSTNISSLPSSIAHFSRENVLQEDSNNNSIAVPSAYMTFSMPKVAEYTVGSSQESSATNISDNTSMNPNMGSNNTSEYPYNSAFPSQSQSQSNEHSCHVSDHVGPEDLSKLVDEMSSIRPVDESSSIRPNSTFDPTPHIVSVCGQSGTAGMQESWVQYHEEYMSNQSMATSSQTSQNGSLYWDNYPLHEKQTMSRSFPDLPMHVHDNPAFSPYGPVSNQQLQYRVPVLKEKQYWV